MSEQDKKWIEKCISEPNKYKIFVDNDIIFVCDISSGDDDYDEVHSFDEYGYYFAKALLEHLGCNVDFV